MNDGEVRVPRVLGVDDFALRRKKRRYGTILILWNQKSREFQHWLSTGSRAEVVFNESASVTSGMKLGFTNCLGVGPAGVGTSASRFSRLSTDVGSIRHGSPLVVRQLDLGEYPLQVSARFQ